MTREGVRIIDGRIFDAREEARRIVEDARREADRIRAEAYAQGMDSAAVRLAELERELAAQYPHARVAARTKHERMGRVREIVGLVVRAQIEGEARHGELVSIDAADGRVLAEVVGFREREAILMPLGPCTGITSASRVVATGRVPRVVCGQVLLGRVLDGLGQYMDKGRDEDELRDSETRFAALAPVEFWPIFRPTPNALERPRIDTPLATGVRAIDGLMTLGRGQRIGLFAGPGVGKSSLLARVAGAAEADVCVICLVGERGREVREFLDARLSAAVKARTVAVVATSDAPSLVRVRAAQVATAIAEWFRERQGAHVLLVLDSLTRLARAQREVGLSAGELPTRHGYPPSVFALLPRIIERAGNFERGSITALYTILEANQHADDPIAEEARSLLDGHIALSRERAASGKWPPIDVLASVSRAMDAVVGDEHRRAATRIRELLAAHRDNADLVSMGAYRSGSDKTLDAALAALPAIDDFLNHEGAEPYQASIERLLRLAKRY
jgi:type III secretion protein N (ATPase)